MRRGWEARHTGGGWFRLRGRARWIGGPVLLGLALVLGGGMLRGLWDRFTMWLWHTTHLVPTTVVGAVVIAVMLALLCRTGC